MKYLILLISLCILNPLFAQINGNGLIKKQRQNIADLQSIDIQFNANIILDFHQEEVMVIQADENILEYIGVYFEDGNLVLDQIEWINPSQQPTITIGCPNLKSVFQGTHSTTQIINANETALTLQGNVGKIIVTGNIDDLVIETTGTDVDAQNLKASTVQISENCKSNVTLNQFDNLVKAESSEANITYLNPVNSKIIKEQANSKQKITYIKFKIKNNTVRRNSYYVKGPNRRNGTFSYGFSLFPYATESENWSIGTKIYQESYAGKLTELITIKREDEGKVITLH